MKFTHTVPAVALVGAATLALAACSEAAGDTDPGASADGSGGGETMTLVLGHAGSTTDPRQLASEELKEILETETDGRITVEIHPNSTLGSWEQMIEGLELGTTDIVIESILALESYTDLASVETAPFLYEDAEHFFEVWDGDLGGEIKSSITEASGFELLGNMYRGARNLTANTPVTQLSDLDGLTLRTPSAATMVETWQTLGARAEAMAWDEVYSALEQGVIDGQENPLDVAVFNALFEVQSDLTFTQHMFANYHFLMSESALTGFSDEDQQLIREAATTVGETYTERTVTNLEEYAATLEAEGMALHELEDRDAWVEKVTPIIDKLPAQVQAWVEQIRSL